MTDNLVTEEQQLEIATADMADYREQVKRLKEALAAMLHAVCHETGFAAAVRQDSGHAYPWQPLDDAEALARAALGDTP